MKKTLLILFIAIMTLNSCDKDEKNEKENCWIFAVVTGKLVMGGEATYEYYTVEKCEMSPDEAASFARSFYKEETITDNDGNRIRVVIGANEYRKEEYQPLPPPYVYVGK